MSDLAAIDWTRPLWLYALALVPVAVVAMVWSLRRHKRALDVFAEEDVRGRTQTLEAGRRSLRGTLLMVALVGLLLAAAGPRWGTETVVTPPVGQEIVFALDVSRSMLAQDTEPNRLERAKQIIRQIVAVMPGAEVGLVVFAGEAALVVPLTPDASALELYLSSVGPDWVSDPSTDLANALSVAIDAFGPSPGTGRAVVLFSDGEDHAGGIDSVTELARERSVEIESIGVGTDTGARIPFEQGEWLTSGGEPVVTRLDQQKLASVAEGSGGVFVAGSSTTGVATVIGRLQALDTGRQSDRSAEQRADRYRWPLAVALFCLGLEAVLRLIGRRRMQPVLAVLVALVVLGMGRSAKPREHYEEGRYAEALSAWRHADQSPDAEPEDAYNRASAAYRLGEFREAAASYAVAARTAREVEHSADSWYNAGNARYRIAEAKAPERDPTEESVKFWDTTVEAYRESLLLDPEDVDAKHNLELALRRRDQAAGGGGGGGGDGGGGGSGGEDQEQPSGGSSGSPQGMSRSDAERLLDALAAQEREALIRGNEDQRAAQPTSPGW